MMKVEPCLNNEICFAVIHVLIEHASIEQLKELGMSERQIARLDSLTRVDIQRASQRSKKEVDIKGILDCALPSIDIPDEWEELLLHGADNDMMAHFFGARPEDCSICRRQLSIDRRYKLRKIPLTEDAKISKELRPFQKSFRYTKPEILLGIAKKHNISIKALWNKLKKWERTL